MNWPLVQIRHVARFKYGSSLPIDERSEGNVSVYGSNGPVGSHDTHNTESPVIVIGRKGSQGKLCYSSDPVFAIDTTYYVDSSCTASDIRWLFHALNTINLDALGQDVGVPGLNRDQAYSQRIPLPPSNVRRAIADYLDTETAHIDTLISKKRRLVDLLEERWIELRRSRILCGLDPVRGGGLTEPWEEMNMGVLIEMQRGHDLPSDDRIEGDVPVVSSGGVSGAHNVAISDGPGVVTGRYGTVGEVFFINEPYWPLNTSLYVKDFRGNHPHWVYFLLASIPLDIDAKKSAVGGINRNVVGSLRVPRPSLHVQQAIADELEEAEELTRNLQKKLETQIQLLSERREALITEVVTGKIPVPMSND